MGIGRRIFLYIGTGSAIRRKYATTATCLTGSSEFPDANKFKPNTKLRILGKGPNDYDSMTSSARSTHIDLLVNSPTPNNDDIPNTHIAFSQNPSSSSSIDYRQIDIRDNISIRERPFSKPPISNWMKTPLDTFPNPLFTMSKEQLSKLNPQELAHLVRIPYKCLEELDEFCIRVLEITQSQILLNPGSISKLLHGIKSLPTFDSIIDCLCKGFEKDKVKLSVLNFIVDPLSPKFVALFHQNLKTILSITNKSAEEKSQILLSYLYKLALTGQVNESPLLLTKPMYLRVMKLVGPKNFAEWYSYLVSLNIQTKDLSLIQTLQKTLANGSEMDKFILRTGYIKPHWHDVLKTDFPDFQRQRMLFFFTVENLKTFFNEAIKTHSIIHANFYLELLVDKFDYKCSFIKQQYHQGLEMSTIENDMNSVLECLLNHVMEFKGPKNSVSVLKYMAKNQLEISFSTLLVMMKQLRKRGTFEDVLLVVNSINLEKLTLYERKALVHEVLLLIKGRYPTSPKILVGYCASIFSGTENSGVKLLNDLQLLGITHGTGELGTISNLDSVQKANIDIHLTGFEFTHTALANIYETIFSSMEKTEITTDLIKSMYDLYITKVEAGDFTDLNDRVINKFISFLLRINPGKKEYKFYKDEERYQMAKKIFADFNEKVWLNRAQRTASLFDLLIYVGLKYHHDVTFAFEIAKLSRKLHIPPSFNSIFPFIQFHYNKQEYKYAELWYNELTKSGVRATSRSSKELFRIVRELKWGVNGFVYRKLQIRNNYKTKEELNKLDSDPIRLIHNQDTEERVTEELISEPYDLNDIEFSNELVAVLNSAK